MCSSIKEVKVIRYYAEKSSRCCIAVVDCLYAVHLLPSGLHHCSVLLFPCMWISEEVFHLEKLYHLTGTTAKGSRLTFQDPAIQHVLSNCLFCCSLPCPLSFPPCPDFHLISFWLIKKKKCTIDLIPICLLLSHPVRPCITSSGLTLSYLTTNEQTNQEPTWEPLHTVPQRRPN